MNIKFCHTQDKHKMDELMRLYYHSKTTTTNRPDISRDNPGQVSDFPTAAFEKPLKVVDKPSINLVPQRDKVAGQDILHQVGICTPWYSPCQFHASIPALELNQM